MQHTEPAADHFFFCFFFNNSKAELDYTITGVWNPPLRGHG
jgi:hypothetical protein